MSTKTRLTPDDWHKAGLTALAASGPEALKAEPLARALGTTKGSFYWHFADVPAFRAALLTYWADTANLALDPPGDRRGAVAQLHDLVKDGFADKAGAEPAIRAWARSDAAAAQAVAELDQQRLAHLQALLATIGVTNPDIARMLYAARIGMGQIRAGSGAENDSSLDTLVDLVLALR